MFRLLYFITYTIFKVPHDKCYFIGCEYTDVYRDYFVNYANKSKFLG